MFYNLPFATAIVVNVHYALTMQTPAWNSHEAHLLQSIINSPYRQSVMSDANKILLNI